MSRQRDSDTRGRARCRWHRREKGERHQTAGVEISTRPRPKEMVREGMGCSMAVKKPEVTTLKPTKRKAKEYSRRADTEEANRALSGWRNRPTTAPAST